MNICIPQSLLQKFQDDIVALEKRLDEKEDELEKQRKALENLQNSSQPSNHGTDMNVGTESQGISMVNIIDGDITIDNGDVILTLSKHQPCFSGS